MGLSLERLEKALDMLERFESYTREEQADILVQVVYHSIKTMGVEAFMAVYRDYMLQNPDIVEAMLETYRRRWLKEFREALKHRRREIKIRRR